ncbi:hypothetical protein [Burkholderia vietnamiensis]|uniref:hypothetical protein n=1 Tax=Burkholderia vietnamiensis TaxID=60552 RepID=UPI001CF1C986|nr:hypothetical protein [Burkholderia vietnamiensis]MCA8448835.1 hypothetical protein [Burkholderia vietnamiensis]
MRKTLLALAALFVVGSAHAVEPVTVHGITLGQDQPPLCSSIDEKVLPVPHPACTPGIEGTFGNLSLFRVDWLVPIGATMNVHAWIGVDTAGKVRLIATQAGVQREDYDRAYEKLLLSHGPATVDGEFFAEWDFQDSVLEVYSPSSDEQDVFAFDDAFAPAALDIVNFLEPNRMSGL